VDISVIIPTYNRSHALRQVITSLSQMNDRSGGHEIIVVDNGSTDDTRRVVEEMATSHPEQHIRYCHEPIPGSLSARHRGAVAAKGDLCVFLDDDVHVERNWLSALRDAFDDQNVVMAGGPSRPLFQTVPPNWLASFYSEDQHGWHCGWLSLFDGGKHVREINPCYIWSLNLAIRRNALFDIGGFHPCVIPKPLQRFQGDGETGLSLKVAAAGLKALYHPEIAVFHEVPASRLTVQYFEQRAYVQGVCDSYTLTRANKQRNQSSSSWKDFVRPMKQIIDALSAKDFEVYRIKRRTAAAYKAGFAFHQEEVNRDPKLLEWVLRHDYWDYQLPDGWETYQANPAITNLPEMKPLQ
jgi:glucosyl-dolichyl phosphate glucuronosyltransferase